jgi:hypothetical protein
MMQNDTQQKQPKFTGDNSTNQNSSLVNHNSTSKKTINNKKALLFIVFPAAIWITLLLIIQYMNKRSPYGSSEYLTMINIFIVPILLTLIVYGLLLLFIKPRKRPAKVIIPQIDIPKPPSYKDSIILFLCGAGALAAAYLYVAVMRIDLGYSGSEGELGAVPLILGGIGTIFASVILTISTLIRRIIFDRNRSRKEHIGADSTKST